MIMSGCQGKPRTPTILEKKCPQCGHDIEMFSIDTEARCENCGFVAYNDTLSCVQWCKYARQCVGDEMYEQMMKIAAKQKEEAAALRKIPRVQLPARGGAVLPQPDSGAEVRRASIQQDFRAKKRVASAARFCANNLQFPLLPGRLYGSSNCVKGRVCSSTGL